MPKVLENASTYRSKRLKLGRTSGSKDKDALPAERSETI